MIHIDGNTPSVPPSVAENSSSAELFLLNGRARQLLAVVFLFLGIACGTVGNFLTLDW
ncbi:hypothetical protein [Curtobacterium sp. ME26]|uniref:hypothetical protein n=1 Tax=Curtobacterium sp. ME26 TaxID=2744254 RepID=UPI0015F52D2C|nr:hypothetical protein [Curtobacterium sp. ME26]